jgi:hypothetical protein
MKNSTTAPFLALILTACAGGPPNMVHFDYQIRTVDRTQSIAPLGEALVAGRRADEMIDRTLPVCKVSMVSPDVPELDVRGTPGVDSGANLSIVDSTASNISSINPCSAEMLLSFSIDLAGLGALGQTSRGAGATIEIGDLSGVTGSVNISAIPREQFVLGTIIGAVDDYDSQTTWTEGRFEAILESQSDPLRVMIVRDGAFAMTD